MTKGVLALFVLAGVFITMSGFFYHQSSGKKWKQLFDGKTGKYLLSGLHDRCNLQVKNTCKGEKPNVVSGVGC